MFVNYPYRFDELGRTATTTYREHVEDLVEITLLTSPGERVNRPEFGAGLASLTFEPNSTALADSADLLTRSNLQRWLQDIITIESVSVNRDDATLSIHVVYTLVGTGERVEQTVVRR